MKKRQPPSARPPVTDFDADDPTVIDLERPSLNGDSGEVTPELQDHCVECGGVVFVDRAALQDSYPEDRCLRSWDGKRWHWCHKLKKSVTYFL